MMKRFTTWAGMSPAVHVAASALFIACASALALFGNPSPVQSQFASQSTWGGTTGGTANAQTMAVANYRLNVGVPITAIAGAANTTSTTLNINSTGVIVVKRATANVGVQNLVGGELVAGLPFTVVYDGTNYRLVSRPPDWVGQTAEFRTTTIPAGYFIEDGSCQSQTGAQFVALFAALGSTYGTGCGGAGTFSMVDSRGRFSAALDAQGSIGAANRITAGGSSCTTVLGTGCGSQNSNLVGTSQLPLFTPTGTINISDPGHQHNILTQDVNVNATGAAVVGNINAGGNIHHSENANTGLNSTNVTFTGNTVGSASPAPFTTLSPILPVIRAVKL